MLALRSEALALLKAGAVVKDVYNSLLQSLKTKNESLAAAFVKNIGFAVSVDDAMMPIELTFCRLVLNLGIVLMRSAPRTKER